VSALACLSSSEITSGTTGLGFFRVAVDETLDVGLVFKCYTFRGHSKSLSMRVESNRADTQISDFVKDLHCFGGLFRCLLLREVENI
jgi:hypothetical protein